MYIQKKGEKEMIYIELLKQIESKGITINQLALELKISPTSLYSAVKGEIPFYPKYRKLIAEYFNKEESILFPGIEQI
jgi:lambda repressor-like predicted transcriptional regulator